MSKYVLTQRTYLRIYIVKVMKTVRIGKTHFGFIVMMRKMSINNEKSL